MGNKRNKGNGPAVASPSMSEALADAGVLVVESPETGEPSAIADDAPLALVESGSTSVEPMTTDPTADDVKRANDELAKNMPSVAPVVHVGPLTRSAISDIVHAEQITIAQVTDVNFVQGILTLVSADAAHDMTLETLGAFVLYVDSLAVDGQKEIITAYGGTWDAELTVRQNLAKAIYAERFPELWTSFVGPDGKKVRKAVKRLENAAAIHRQARKVATDEQIQKVLGEVSAFFPSEAPDAPKTDEAPSEPVTAESLEGSESEAPKTDGTSVDVKVDAEIAANASLSAALSAVPDKPTPPKQGRPVFIALFTQGCVVFTDNVFDMEATKKNRETLVHWYGAMGFSRDEIAGWITDILTGKASKRGR